MLYEEQCHYTLNSPQISDARLCHFHQKTPNILSWSQGCYTHIHLHVFNCVTTEISATPFKVKLFHLFIWYAATHL